MRSSLAQVTFQRFYGATSWLAGLVRDGVLIEVEKGARKRATRFRFNFSDSTPVQDTIARALAKAAAHRAPGQRPPPAVHSEPKATSPPAPRKQTTYELVERKKALHDLIKDFGHEDDYDYWSEDEQKRYNRLQADLKQVNSLLAGIGE